ncbi:MAG TPA: hypothetical protein VM536_10305 [Chloroflexia bacterium]|nr:hypothetical protein [Chloroflexia bacterium]
MLTGRRHIAARAAWIVVTLATLGLDIAGIPAALAHLRRVCETAACTEAGGVTAADIQTLLSVGLSPGWWAAYAVSLSLIFTLLYTAVGALIFWRRSDDPVALLTALALVTFGGAAFTGPMGDLAAQDHTWDAPVAILTYVGQVTFGALFYLFPDGRFAPHWARWLALLYAVLWVPAVFFPNSAANVIAVGPLFVLFVISLVVCQVYRYRRVSTLRQRQQTKWVVYGTGLAIGTFLGLITLEEPLRALVGSDLWTRLIVNTGIYVAMAGFPLALAMAMLRSRLWDIDRLINGTLVYGLLTASLVLVYVGLVLALERVLGLFAGQGTSELAIVAATLTIATLFSPLRRRIQAAIDRRFYRHKYDAGRTLAAFSARLRDEVDLQALGGQVVAAVEDTMRPTHVVLWLRSPLRDAERSRTDGF